MAERDGNSPPRSGPASIGRRAYEAMIQADAFKAECPDAYKVVRAEVLDEVVKTLNDGCGWKPGTPEYKAMVQTAALIEQGRLKVPPHAG